MMPAPRLIPVLLLSGRKIVKTVKFGERTYLGDPLNIIRIFNEKEVDELCVLDIDASIEGRGPNWSVLESIVSEAFMPLSYGGGLTNLDDCKRAVGVGFEKVAFNSAIVANPSLLESAAATLGSQAVVASIDARQSADGKYEAFAKGGKVATGSSPAMMAMTATRLGAGEIIINSIDRDGTMAGYDLDLITSVVDAVDVPVVALGGASSLENLSQGILSAGASAAAAGSLFVFFGKRRAVLINPPSQGEFIALLSAATGQEYG